MILEGSYKVIPLQAGVSLGGPHIGVKPGEVGHKIVPTASICGAPVEEGQQGAVRDRLSPDLPHVEAIQLPVQRGGKVGGDHEEQGSWNLAQPGQGVIVCRPPPFQMRHGKPGARFLAREAPDGGCVAPPRAYLCGLKYVGGVEHRAGGEGHPEERGHVASPSRMWLQGSPQPLCCLCAPRALRARPTNNRGPRMGLQSPPLKWDGGVLRCWSSRCACCCAPPAPLACRLRTQDVRFPCGHEIASDDPLWETRAPQVVRETPGQVPVGWGFSCMGNSRVPFTRRGEATKSLLGRKGGGGQLPSATLSHRCTQATALWGARRSCSNPW